MKQIQELVFKELAFQWSINVYTSKGNKRSRVAWQCSGKASWRKRYFSCIFNVGETIASKGPGKGKAGASCRATERGGILF